MICYKVIWRLLENDYAENIPEDTLAGNCDSVNIRSSFYGTVAAEQCLIHDIVFMRHLFS
jgi:hypothetical protein